MSVGRRRRPDIYAAEHFESAFSGARTDGLRKGKGVQLRGSGADRRPEKGVEHNINNSIEPILPTVFSFDLETWKHSVNKRIKEGFSKWIYQLEGKKISGMDLHRKTGMSVSEVYLYLNGTRMPSKAKFEKVFDAYDTNLCSFLEFLDLRNISETTFYDRALKRRD